MVRRNHSQTLIDQRSEQYENQNMENGRMVESQEINQKQKFIRH